MAKYFTKKEEPTFAEQLESTVELFKTAHDKSLNLNEKMNTEIENKKFEIEQITKEIDQIEAIKAKNTNFLNNIKTFLQ
jgi:DNA-binding transcriptional regulator GbsR (MarR family)